jgi:hypothetical protein
MNERRTLCWWSTGAASAIMCLLTLRETPSALIVRCETNNEDPDNYRFEADVMRRLNRATTILQSDEYNDVWEVWQRERFMSGPHGAPCTREMKVAPRLAFQRPNDVHVFGYTADSLDVARFERFKENFFELTVRAPLIEAGITKAASLAMVERMGIALPRTYAMGFHNANCMGTGCVKATSPDYWSLYRHHYPENFARTAAFSREIGCRLARINDERIFLDEIPADWPMTNPIVPACDFLCAIAEMEPAK